MLVVVDVVPVVRLVPRLVSQPDGFAALWVDVELHLVGIHAYLVALAEWQTSWCDTEHNWGVLRQVETCSH